MIFPPLSGNTVLANGDICANSAVIPYRWNITYTNVDDGGNPNNVQFVIDWDDGIVETIILGVGDNFLQNTGSNAYGSTVIHFFPATGGNVMCEYVPEVFLQVGGTPCPSTIQNPSPVVRWNTDDQNTGVLDLSEQATSQNVFPVCAGETVTIRFQDRSIFNCLPPQFIGAPSNDKTRWFQFIYGSINTITGSGIDIDIGTGTNPEGAGLVNLAGGGSYNSVVVQRSTPIVAPSEISFDITVPTDASTGGSF